MSTGVETWADVHTLGAVYPFAGSEFMLTVVGVTLWGVWHFWQLANEAKELDTEATELKDKARISKILESKSIN